MLVYFVLWIPNVDHKSWRLWLTLYHYTNHHGICFSIENKRWEKNYSFSLRTGKRLRLRLVRVKAFPEKKMFSCVWLHFKKIFGKYFLMFGYILENTIENTFFTCCSHFLTFSQLPNKHLMSFIPKNSNKTQKDSIFSRRDRDRDRRDLDRRDRDRNLADLDRDQRFARDRRDCDCNLADFDDRDRDRDRRRSA